MKAYVGVDVSKKKLDVTLLYGPKKRRKRVNNSEAGIKKLQGWLEQRTEGTIHMCMESTSVYWEELAEMMDEAGYEVSVVNPVRIKGYHEPVAA